MIANPRVRRLLEAAERHGHVVTPSEHVPECWKITAARWDSIYGVPSLTVYTSGPRGATVYWDSGQGRDWPRISQRRAFFIMAQGML